MYGSANVTHGNVYLSTAREGNVFTGICHSLQVEGGVGSSRLGIDPNPPLDRASLPPLEGDTPTLSGHLVEVIAAVGTHPTGMHSCFIVQLNCCHYHYH